MGACDIYLHDMAVIWLASVRVFYDNKNRLLMCWHIVLKMHLCALCLNKVKVAAHVFPLCVCGTSELYK